MQARKAFTLIELLIVVAIIAILAAIAVPNFLEAQVRAKVSRSKADMRTQTVAMESYFVDWNRYTRDSDSSLDIKDVGPAAADPSNPIYWRCANGARQLTTPVAYLTSLLADPFVVSVQVSGAGAQGYRIGSGTWSYPDAGTNSADNQGSTAVFQSVGAAPTFVMIGVGPDKSRARMAYKCFPYMSAAEGGVSDTLNTSGQPRCYVDYDPTNGTVSVGDIYFFGGSHQTGRWMRNGAVVGSQTPISGAY